MADRASVVEKIREIAERVGASVGLEIVDVQLLGGGGSRVLRLFIDHIPGSDLRVPVVVAEADAVESQAEGTVTADAGAIEASGGPTDGVSLSDCSYISHAVGAILDVEDIIPGGNYTLEVSSPGVERKLSRVQDFERFIGHKVKVVLRQPIENQKAYIGALREVAQGAITLEPKPGKSVQIPLDQVEKANLKFEW
ncbi:MAG: ribosome maturation factor RimP [Acidobacteriota bacterium]